MAIESPGFPSVNSKEPRRRVNTEKPHGKHTIGDDCAPNATPDLLDTIVDKLHYRKYLSALRQFISQMQPEQEGRATFSEGTPFDPVAYPTGTIVRMQNELHKYKTRRHSINPPEEFYDDEGYKGITYGIVVIDRQGKKALYRGAGRAKSDSHQKQTASSREMLDMVVTPMPLVIGEWEHSLVVDQSWSANTIPNTSSMLYFAPPQDYWELQQDVFYKVTNLDILAVGKGEKAKELSRGKTFNLFSRTTTEPA